MIRSNAFSIKPVTRTLMCIAAIVTLSSNALSQSGADLPLSTSQAISISSSQQTQINAFIEAWAGRALSDNALDTKKAIETLTKPLHARSVSVAFRQAYAQAITPLMNELESKGSIGASLASLRIAGDLATPTAATRIRSAMGSDDLGIQLFAIARVGNVFSTTKAHGPAMTPGDAKSLITAIESVASEPSIDNELLKACVRSLNAGTRLSSKDMGDARSTSIVALSEVVGAQLRSLSVNDDPSFIQGMALEAASAATASISDISSDTTPDAVKAGVGLGGDIISVALRRVFGKTIKPVDQRALTIQSVQAGETLLFFALRKDAELDHKFAGTVRQTKFAQQLSAGDDRTFRNEASLLLGPGSPLVKAFGFEDERFVR